MPHWLRLLFLVTAASLGVGCAGMSDGPQEAEEVESASHALCGQPQLTLSPPSPVPANTALTLNATATCASGETAEYQFSMIRVGVDVSWRLLRSYAPNPSHVVPSSNLPPGRYRFFLEVRRQGTPSRDSQTSLYAMIGNVCTGLSMPRQGDPPAAGSLVSFTPRATCTTPETVPEFQIDYRAMGVDPAAVRLLPDWGQSPRLWDTTGHPSGRYVITTRTRASGNASDREAPVDTSDFLLGDVCSHVTLTLPWEDPTPVPGTATLTASARCFRSAQPRYRFAYRRTGTNEPFVDIADWSTSPFSWDTTGVGAGRYDVHVRVRGHANASDYEATATSSAFFVGNTCSGVTVTASPSARQKVGTSVRLDALAQCTPGTVPQYKFLGRTGAGYQTICDWGSSATCTWNTAGWAADTGVYVWVRGTGNATESPEGVASLAYPLDPISTRPACPSTGAGTAGFCDSCLCGLGQGHCSSGAECAAGLVCAADQGRKFGLDAETDVCLPNHCTNLVQDTSSGEDGVDCGGACGPCLFNCSSQAASGGDNFCETCFCGPGQGDCDSASDCQPGLACAEDYGARFGMLRVTDVCLPPHCTNDFRDIALGEVGVDCGGAGCGPCLPACTGTPGDGDYCIGCTCTAGGGDCDYDRDCQPGLVCADDAGPRFGYSNPTDVCLPRHCTNDFPDTALGETGTDCGGPCGPCLPDCSGMPGGDSYCIGCACTDGQGDCDAHRDCAPGLFCASNLGPQYGYSAATDVCVLQLGGGSSTPPGSQQCTTDAHCTGGQVCWLNQGPRYGHPTGSSVCANPHCLREPTPACGTVTSPCGTCSNQCGNGVKDGDESDVDCGGSCPKCERGEACDAASDCNSGLVCGIGNGACFNGPRAQGVCWSTICEDGVQEDLNECGSPDSPCGPNCACATGCDADDVNSACPGANEVCKRDLGGALNSATADVCLSEACPSDDPQLCGGLLAPCGPCLRLPDCSAATCANPSDGAGGFCARVCSLGDTCVNNLVCPAGSTCEANPNGTRSCRSSSCADRVLVPPICGTPDAECGPECPRCVAQCEGRQCGTDPVCGTSCGGACPMGRYCDPNGQCVPRIALPVARLPDFEDRERSLPDLAPVGESTSGVVAGAVRGAFSVSDTGLPNYTIPIDVPPGRAGVEPALSLRYGGSRSNGELGVGWALEGLSKITRCPRTFAMDGHASAVQNDNSDAFCLDGKRLVEVAGTQAEGFREYRTIIDSFARVVSYRIPNGFLLPEFGPIGRVDLDFRGPDYFKVWTKDGRILTYGRSPDSLILARNGVRMGWLLNRVEDRSDNTMTVHYDNKTAVLPPDSTLAPVRPSVIAYTGHRETAGTRQIRFSYEARTDRELRYAQGGVGWLIEERLKRITTYVDNAPVKNYELHYKPDSELSLVEAIAECEGDGSTRCKAPTKFRYRQESGFTPGEYQANIPAAVQLDVNGDGIPDFLETVVTVNGVEARPAATAAFVTADVLLAIGGVSGLLSGGVGWAVTGAYAVLKPILFGLLAEKPEIRYRQTMWLGNGSRSRPTASNTAVSNLPCPTNAPLYFMDYDRDGKDDVLGRCRNNLFMSRSEGTGVFALQNTAVLQAPAYLLEHPNGYNHPGTPPIIFDLDGDSLQDVLLCTNPSQIQVRRRLSPTEGFSDPLPWSPEYAQSPLPQLLPEHTEICRDARPTYSAADIDGDGTPDLLYRGKNGWRVLRYTSVLRWYPVAFNDINSSETGDGVLLGDLNGDGLLDAWSGRGTDAVIWLNSGNRKFFDRKFSRPRSAPASYVHARSALLDYDADGRDDTIETFHSNQYGSDIGLYSDWANSVLTPTRTFDAITARPASIKYIRPDNGLPDDIAMGIATDIDGDGNKDVFGEEAAVAYGSGSKNTLLEAVEDGVGNVVSIFYDRDSTGTLSYKSDCGTSTWPEMCLKRLTGIVGYHTEWVAGTNANIPDRRYDYEYRNARISVTGHGWLGFDRRTIRVSAGDVSYVMSQKSYGVLRVHLGGPTADDTTPPYVYPLAGLAESIVVDRRPGVSELEDSVDGYRRRTRTVNSWVVRHSASGLPYPAVQSRETKIFEREGPWVREDYDYAVIDGPELSSCWERFDEYDAYGNVTKRESVCDGNLSRTTTTFSQNTVDWLIQNPELIATVSDSGTDFQEASTLVVDPSYDPRTGLLTSVARAPSSDVTQQRTTSYLRNAYGNVYGVTETEFTNEDPRHTSILYDAAQVYPFQVTNAEGHVTQITFDHRWGTPATIVDPNGVSVQNSYDGFGRLRRTEDANGYTVFGYLPATGRTASPVASRQPRVRMIAERLSYANQLQSRSVREVDNAGRLVTSETDGLGGTTLVETLAYDRAGRLRERTLPHVAGSPGSPPVVHFEYDGFDRLTEMRHADDTFVKRQYASRNTLSERHHNWLGDWRFCNELGFRCGQDVALTTDEVGNRTVTLTDVLNRTIRTIDEDNIESGERFSSYHYGPFGLAIASANHLSSESELGVYFRSILYDDYGRTTSDVDADGASTTFTYNGFDEIKTTTDGNAVVRARGYDRLGRLLSITDPSGTTTWTYDGAGPEDNAVGQLTGSAAPPTADSPFGHRIRYTYEAIAPRNRGALASVEYQIDGVSYPVQFAYDALGRPDTVTYPRIEGGPVVTKNRYDARGFQTALQEIGSSATRPVWELVRAHAGGQFIEEEGVGNGARTTYSYDPRRHWLTSIKTTLATDAIQDLSYRYYHNGQLQDRIEPSGTRTYTYDELGRLQAAQDIASTGGATLTEYDYDELGNLTDQGTRSTAYRLDQPYRVASVDGNSYEYDANGNVRQRTGAGIPGGIQTIDYTPFDLPSSVVTGQAGSVSTARFEYSADEGRVVRRDEETTRYFAGDFYQRVVDNTTGETLEERFRIFVGGRIIGEIIRAGGIDETLYFHTDHLGSVEVISTSAGDVTSRSFEPFGMPVETGASPEMTRAGFTGHQHDGDLKLIDMRGRLYDPIAGRFMSPDPITQAPFSSQGLNRYSYVFNDPINHTDPSGFMGIDTQFGVGISTWSTGVVGATLISGFGQALGGGAGAGLSGSTGALGGLGGGMAIGLGGGALNVASTLLLNPFGAQAGGSYSTGAGTIAQNSSGPRQNASHATAQNNGHAVGVPLVQEGPSGPSMSELLDEGVPEELGACGGGDCLAMRGARRPRGAPMPGPGAAPVMRPLPRNAHRVPLLPVGPSSRALARALRSANQPEPPGSAAHHIVAGSAPAAAPARAVLQRFGVGINDAQNGVFLPQPVHARIHTNSYYQTVNSVLSQATSRQQVIEVLQVLRDTLSTIRP